MVFSAAGGSLLRWKNEYGTPEWLQFELLAVVLRQAQPLYTECRSILKPLWMGTVCQNVEGTGTSIDAVRFHEYFEVWQRTVCLLDLL
jgi:hypothetical protein